MDGDGQRKPGVGRLRGVLGGLGLLGLLGAMIKKEQGSLSPEAVWATPRVEALADFAMDLAARADEGPDAVKKLRARAKGRPKALRRAAAFVRFGGAIQEDRISHRANRLLLAAATDSLVVAATAQEDEWFDRIAALVVLPLPEAFQQLAEIEPRLRTLRDELQEAAAAAAVGHGGQLQPEDNDRLWGALVEGLKSLLGPDSGQTERLLRSGTALDMVRVHLATVAGLTFCD